MKLTGLNGTKVLLRRYRTLEQSGTRDVIRDRLIQFSKDRSQWLDAFVFLFLLAARKSSQ